MAERAAFTVRLTPEAKATLQAFCYEHGISLNAFFEAAAQMAGEGSYEAQRNDLVLRARRIDGGHRFR